MAATPDESQRQQLTRQLEVDLQAQIPPLQAQLQELETRVFDAQRKPETPDRTLREAMVEVRTTRRLLEDESKALTLEIGRREKQLRVLRHTDTDAAKWVEYQIANMRAWQACCCS